MIVNRTKPNHKVTDRNSIGINFFSNFSENPSGYIEITKITYLYLINETILFCNKLKILTDYRLKNVL